MHLLGKARRVRIYLNDGDRIGHQPAHSVLLEFLRSRQACGATVFRAIEGFGGPGVVHTETLVDLQARLPLVIEWLDTPARVEELLEPLKQLVPHGLMTIDETEVVLVPQPLLREVTGWLTAGEVMTKDIAIAQPETPISQVVLTMLGKAYRAVPVVKDGRPVGIITNSDLVQRAGLGARLELLASLDPGQREALLAPLTQQALLAEQVMTPQPVTVPSTMALPEVAKLMMERRLKRLPVVDPHGLLRGMLSRLDLLRTATDLPRPPERDLSHLAGLNGAVPLTQVMRLDVPTVFPDTPLDQVLTAVMSTRLNRALVLDEQHHVLGLISDADLLQRLTPTLRPGALQSLMLRLPLVGVRPEQRAALKKSEAKNAQDLMTPKVPQIYQGASLGQATSMMLQGAYKLLAVVDEQKQLVGVLDRADLLRGLMQASLQSPLNP